MTGITDDPNHPGIRRGRADTAPVPQNDTYLVLSAAERAKGFVRPVRGTYRHVGIAGPRYELRDLTEEEKARYEGCDYIKFEAYPESERPVTGRFWTANDLQRAGHACGAVTTMGRELAETYARDPHFYGATYCCGCGMHRPVGAAGEFVWDGTQQRVGT